MRRSVFIWLLFLQLSLVIVLGHLVLRNLASLQEARAWPPSGSRGAWEEEREHDVDLLLPGPARVSDPDTDVPAAVTWDQEMRQDMEAYLAAQPVEDAARTGAAPMPPPIVTRSSSAVTDARAMALSDGASGGSFAPVPSSADSRAEGLRLFDPEVSSMFADDGPVAGFDGAFDSTWADPQATFELLPADLRQMRV